MEYTSSMRTRPWLREISLVLRPVAYSRGCRVFLMHVGVNLLGQSPLHDASSIF
jgi:hypothetical protein